MSWRLGPVGPRGLTVLALTAVVGVLLADHGWASYQGAAAPGSLSGGMTAAGPTRTGNPSPSKAAGKPKHAVPTGSTATPSSSASSAGPLLTAQSYAPYSFQVWPGPMSPVAQAALTGLSVSVHLHGSGLSVTAGVKGQPESPPRFYPAGARVYVVEASMGDDSGDSDYNLGDDGLVVTDAQGRLVP